MFGPQWDFRVPCSTARDIPLRTKHMRLAAYAATIAARAEQFPHMAYRFVGAGLLRFFWAAAPTNI